MTNKYEQKLDLKLDFIVIFSTIIVATFVFSVNGILTFHPSMPSNPTQNQKAFDNKNNDKLKLDPTFEKHIPKHIMQGISDVESITDSPKPNVGHL